MTIISFITFIWLSGMKRSFDEMEESSCAICFDDITKDNLIEYKLSCSDEWFSMKSPTCADCIFIMRDSQYHDYIERVQKTDCKKELRRLMTTGPPIWISDPNLFEVPEGQHVESLRTQKGTESAKLKDALDGEERVKLWEELKTLHNYVDCAAEDNYEDPEEPSQQQHEQDE